MEKDLAAAIVGYGVVWGCIIFTGFEEEGLNSLFRSKPPPPRIILHLLVIVDLGYQVKPLLSNNKKRQWLETISQIDKERKEERKK